MDDPDAYLVPRALARGEVREKGSRFLAFLTAAGGAEEALAFVASLRREYHDARHLPWAFRAGWGGGMEARSSDDGEPSGTAGAPILRALEAARVSDACLAVVRYFGGVKLGTGGLSRAFRAAAEAALQGAELEPRVLRVVAEVDLPYPLEGLLRREAERVGALLGDLRFGEGITATVAVPRSQWERFEGFLRALSETSGGRVRWKSR